MHIRDLVVEVRDKDLVRLGQVTEEFLDILIEDQFNNVGSWELRLPSTHHLAPALRVPGSGIVITDHSGTTLFSGPTTQPEDATTVQESGGILTAKGLSDTVMLVDRIAFPEPSNVDPTTQTLSHDVRTGPVETLMHEYVNANIGPGAPSARRDTRLQMGTDSARGSVVTKKARFPVLGQLLADMAAPEGLGFRVVQVDDHLEFQTYEVVDRTDGIRLDVKNNTLAGHRVAIGPPGATHVIVAGQGELVDRTFRLYTTTESLAAASEWGRRIERFVDQRQTDDPDELDRAGLEVLAEEGYSQISVQVVPMENFSVQYGHDWSMGDKVVVVVVGVELAAIVTGYVLRNNDKGFRMGAILGDPRRLANDDTSARVTKIEARVSNLERGSEKSTVDHGPALDALDARLDAVEPKVANVVAGDSAWKYVGVSDGVVYVNSWFNTGSGTVNGRWRKLPTGQVEVQGTISGGSSGTVAFTLPAGYRPNHLMTFAAVANGAAAGIQVETDGDVKHLFGSTTSFAFAFSFSLGS
jgi:hypothetical protein